MTMLSDVPGTDIMAVCLLKKLIFSFIFSPETAELTGSSETKHLTWQQRWFSISEDNEELEEHTWEKGRGLLPERRNICEKVYILKLHLHRRVGWMTSLSPVGSISCDGSSVSHLLPLSPNYDSCEGSSSGKPNCKSCRKIWFEEVCCWILDHQQRDLRLPWNLQRASSSSSCEWTSSAKGR